MIHDPIWGKSNQQWFVQFPQRWRRKGVFWKVLKDQTKVKSTPIYLANDITGHLEKHSKGKIYSSMLVNCKRLDSELRKSCVNQPAAPWNFTLLLGCWMARHYRKDGIFKLLPNTFIHQYVWGTFLCRVWFWGVQFGGTTTLWMAILQAGFPPEPTSFHPKFLESAD